MPSKKVLGGIALAAVLTIATVITVPAVLVRNGADGAGVTTSTSTSTTTGESQSPPPPSVGSAAIVPPTSIPSSPTTRPSSLPVPSPVVEPDTSVPIATTPVQIAGDEMGEVGLQDAALTGAATTGDAINDEGCTSDAIELDELDGTPYYHCCYNRNSKVGSDILLLHGASFSKENWRRKGILADLCSSVSVVASDLPVNANWLTLIDTLEKLEARGEIRLPATIVTPSASGYSIVDWIFQAPSLDDMPKYISTWVPVAPVDVPALSDAQLRSLSGLVDILAIYGSNDNGGAAVSMSLGELADAMVVKLDGGHAVYLKSPEAFADTILDYLNVDS